MRKKSQRKTSSCHISRKRQDCTTMCYLIQTVGSSLKSVMWLPLPWTRRHPPCDAWHSSFHPGRNFVRPTFHLLRIFHSRRLSPDGRGGRFNFPGQTCSDPLVALTRRTSAADNSDSSDSLARQTLAIRRIHFRLQSKSKFRQYWQPSLLNCHSSLM